jgi:hypothetical protein
MLAWDAEHGRSQVGMLADIYRTRVMVQQGSAAVAADLVPSLLEDVLPMEHAEFVAPALVVAAQVAVERDDRVRALGLLRDFAERTEDAPSFRCHYLPDALRAAVALGEIALAESLVPDAAVATTNRHRLALLAAGAILAEARGERGAAGMYGEAAGAWADHGNVVEQTLLLAAAARCLASAGEERAAEETMGRARAAAAGVPGWRMIRDPEGPLAQATAP